MEQLIFIGIIVLFSILEAVARKGKAQRGQEESDLPGLPGEPPEGAGGRGYAGDGPAVPDHDDEPSYDEAMEVGGKGRGTASSEGLIPSDVWEEIQALARGDTPTQPRKQQPRPVPAPTPGSRPRRPPEPAPPVEPRAPVRARTAPVPAKAPLPAAPVQAEVPQTHPIHLSHPKFGTPMSGRLTAAAQGAEHRVPEEVKAARVMLGAGRAQLRQAVILQELLGPPVSLRGSGMGHQPDE